VARCGPLCPNGFSASLGRTHALKIVSTLTEAGYRLQIQNNVADIDQYVRNRCAMINIGARLNNVEEGKYGLCWP
jgi:RNA polymerase-binding transcription factor DksA